MGLRRWVVSVVVATMCTGGGLVAIPAASATPAATTTCSNAFFGGDNRLGPDQLPTAGSLFPIVRGYNRLAGLTASQFLDTYWDPTANMGAGGWRYPPDNGFLLNGAGQPVQFVMSLGAGQEVDRFGSEFGAFLAPFDTPYAARALPPMSLDNFDPAFTCNYHVYKVVKSFKAETGPIAPGFGQPGRGLQYQLVSSLLPGAPASANVMWLLNNGYIVRIAS